MRRKLKIFVIYFPVILVGCQVATNLLYFVSGEMYNKLGFLLNLAFGVNILFAVFLLCFTYWFKFCAVSRYSAWAEILFAANYMIIQQDNLYNIMFQLIVGALAMILTFRYFIIKFPLCTIALVWRFFKSVTKEKSCSKGMDLWERKTYHTIVKNYNGKILNNG